MTTTGGEGAGVGGGRRSTRRRVDRRPPQDLPGLEDGDTERALQALDVLALRALGGLLVQTANCRVRLAAVEMALELTGRLGGREPAQPPGGALLMLAQAAGGRPQAPADSVPMRRLAGG